MSTHAIENAKSWAAQITEWAGYSPELGGYDPEPGSDDAMQNAALEVKVSGSWEPGSKPVAESYMILLSTGGPALRVVGDLDRGEPVSASLEWQDWGTPWTPYLDANESDLLVFASQFYFGE